MSLSKEEKSNIINEYAKSKNDTATPQVQIALLTHKLAYLTKHFKTNKNDHHSRQGLLKLVGRRRKFLNYLQSKNKEEYTQLIQKLNIRK